MLAKSTAFVTGGGSGLGAAAVHALLKKGASVMVGDLSYEAYERNILQSVKESDKVAFCQVDVTQPETITAALDKIPSKFESPLSAVVNSAGIAIASKTLNKKGLPHKGDAFEKVLAVNTVGAFHVARLTAERMQHNPLDDQQLRGCVIQTASIAAYEGQIGQVAYAASKAAIIGMTLPMARDLANLSIRVMTIAPGLFDTDLLSGLPDAVKAELGSTVPCPSRLGSPREYGQLVVQILENAMLNGSVIRLDGALRMPP